MSEKSTSHQQSRKWKNLRLARRISQAVFCMLFFWLIGVTAAITGSSVDTTVAEGVPYPVEAFLNIDPLAGAIVLFSTKTIPTAMLWGLITLATGILLGRGFCGWICPMGTINHLASEIKPGLKGKRRRNANRTRPYQKLKYLILIAILAAALCGSAVGGLLDPLCLATRGIALALLPWFEWSVGGTLETAIASNNSSLQAGADSVYDLLGGKLFSKHGVIVSGGLLMSLVFVAVLVANRIIPRFWCRGLCPLGALLGLVGRFGLLSLKKNESACTKCGKCELHCSGAATPLPGEEWHRTECDLCLNCVADCKDGAVEFGLVGWKSDGKTSPDLNRRSVIGSAVAGVVLVPAMRTGTLVSPKGRPDPDCIRPPGATAETDFLARCIRCGQCMKICPNNALHPALDEAGFEGLWTPVLVARIGYCEPTCTLCTKVCPTGAIRSLTEGQKLGKDNEEMVRLGTAFIDRGRCLPWAMETPCIVCEEFCPVSPKAITYEEKTIERNGSAVSLKLPQVDPNLCNGCGACEFMCPVHDKAAIRVSSAGESRSPSNELLLHRPKKK
jgi:MauM/NapG family ferredoxin protein